jgi:hypothetical protein
VSVYRTEPELDGLIARLRTRANGNPVATRDEIAALETCVGHELPRVLVRIYTEVANGGFGPACGFYPVSEVGKKWELWTDVDEPGWEAWQYPDTMLEIAEHGCAIYYCVDLSDPDLHVWMFEPGGFIADDDDLYAEEDELEPTSADEFMEAVFERRVPFVQWLERWLTDPSAT